MNRRDILVRYVILAVGLLLVFGVGLAVYARLDRSTITITLKPKHIDITQTNIYINGQTPLLVSATPDISYRETLPKGSYSLQIESEGFDTLEQTIDIGFRKHQTIEVTLTKTAEKPALTLADELYEGDASTVKNAQYFGNGAWLVFNGVDTTSGLEGSFVVARREGKSWRIIEEGTDIDFSDPDYDEAPDDLLQFMEARR